MIKLEYNTDSIFPPGLEGTAFEVVFKALQSVAAGVFSVDDAAWRSAVAWGYYLAHDLDSLAAAEGGREFLATACVSEQVPLIKDTQTAEDLADLLRRWSVYKPTFSALEGLYIPYKATVDVLPVTDEASQAVIPSGDTKGAFYLAIRDISGENPLTIPEAVEIALKATPIGSHPLAYYGLSGDVIPQSCGCVYGDVNIFAGVDENAIEPPPPATIKRCIRLRFGVAGNDVTVNTSARSSVALKYYYGGVQYGGIGKYLIGDGLAPLHFDVVKAETKSGAAVPVDGLTVESLNATGTDLYLFNRSGSAKSLASVYIQFPVYTYGVYRSGGRLDDTENFGPFGAFELYGANQWSTQILPPNALYQLVWTTDGSAEVETYDPDTGAYAVKSEFRVMSNYGGATGIYIMNTSFNTVTVCGCRYRTAFPETFDIEVQPEPQDIVVGQTTKVPAGTTKLKSKYPWAMDFTNGSLANAWYPQQESTPGINVDAPSETQAMIPSSFYNEVIIDNGTLYKMSQNPDKYFRAGPYNRQIEFYTGFPGNYPRATFILLDITDANTTFQHVEYDLPGDLYSISGTTLTWNENSHAYRAFYGLSVKAY